MGVVSRKWHHGKSQAAFTAFLYLNPFRACYSVLSMIYNKNGRHERPKKRSGGSTDMGVTEVKLLTKPFWGIKYSSGLVDTMVFMLKSIICAIHNSRRHNLYRRSVTTAWEEGCRYILVEVNSQAGLKSQLLVKKMILKNVLPGLNYQVIE